MAGQVEYLSDRADHRPGRREAMEGILHRMELLRREDRFLLELYLVKEVTFSDLARLTGMGRKRISRQIRQLVRRLAGGAYLRIRQNRRLFNAATLRVAYDRFLLGLSYQRIGQKRGLSRRQVQAIVRRLQDWLDGSGQAGSVTGPAGMKTAPARSRAGPRLRT